MIYFPEIWEKSIRPGDAITMQLWPEKGKTSMDPDGDMVAKYGKKSADVSSSTNQADTLPEDCLVFKDSVGRTFSFHYDGSLPLEVRALANLFFTANC